MNYFEISVTRRKIFILGNQKSGTTVISKLIEQSTGIKTLHDFSPQYYEYLSLLSENKISFKNFQKHAIYEFVNYPIIKEPQLTFSFDKILNFYKKGQFVLIIRDPRDNIRSILNRVNIEGNLDNIEIEKANITNAWKTILLSKNIGVKSNHYIENLAHRWNLVYEIYKHNSDRIILVKYENFLFDKIKTIKKILSKLSLNYKYDISEKIDIQYQPKGNKNISWIEFFGKNNLEKINNICSKGIEYFGYEK